MAVLPETFTSPRLTIRRWVEDDVDRRAGPDTLEIGYWIHHDKANVASRGVPMALGFEFTGETPDGVAAPNEVGIDCGWVMTRDRWAALVHDRTART